jgi:hypothetical protein
MATYYWVGGTGTWDNANTANWSATSGGAGGAGVPSAASLDVAIFDANSGTGTCTVASTASVRTLTFGAANIVLDLSADFSLGGGSVLFTAGTINLNSFTLTSLAFNTDGSATRAINFGTGKIVLTLNGGTVWNSISQTNFSCTGSRRVESVYAGSAGTREFFFASSSGGVEANSVSLYVIGGSDTISFRGRVNDLSFSGFTGTFNATVQGTLVYGNLSLNAGMSFNGTTVSLLSTSAGRTVAFDGVTMNANIAFNGAGGGWTLQDNLSISSILTLTLTAGTLDADGNNVSIGNFALGVGTKTLAIGSGTWTVAGSGTAWNANTNVANLTVSPSTGVINMTSASAKTFAGGGQSWPTLNQGGAGALTIQQSNSFANITNSVQPATITLTSGTTQTVAAFGVSGTAGNLITLNASTPGSQSTLSDSIGTNEVSFVSIQDIKATGGANWNAFLEAGNVDAGNNVGWDFFPAIRRVFREVFRPIFRPVF